MNLIAKKGTKSLLSLAFSLVLAFSLCVLACATEQDTLLSGTVEACSEGLDVTGTEKVLVTNPEKITLDFIKADENNGRNQDGWWAGIRIFAPDALDEDALNAVLYRQSGSDGWSEGISFMSRKASADGADVHYIEAWMLVNPELIAKAEEGGLTVSYEFDWQGNGFDGDEQKVDLVLDTGKLELIHSEGCSKTVDEEAVAPDCTNEGKGEVSHCSVCTLVIDKGESVPKLGHDFTEKKIDKAHLAKAATCTSYAEYYFGCSRCDAVSEESFEYTEGGFDEHIKQEKADKKYLVSEADCENPVKYYVSCKICGVAIKGETFGYGKPLYHLYMLEKVSKKAGLDKDGATNFYCSNCGKADNVPIPFAGIKSVALSGNTFAFNGKAVTPGVTVTDKNGKVLEKGTDYTVSYKNNKAPGKATATVTFKGKYEGSEALSFTISQLPAPGKLSCKTEKNSATLTWSKVSYATGYKVYVKTADGKYTVNTVSTTSITVKGLSPATKYTFVVKPYATVDGKTLVSDSAKRLTASTKPLAVSSLTAVTGESAVALKWSKVAGADSYSVYMYNSKTKKYELYKTVRGTSLKIENLRSATTYAFKVAALKNNAKGESKQVKATTKPLAVSSVTATASASAVALKWSKVKGADSYSVYLYNAKTKKYELYKTVTGTSLKIENLRSATTYAFKVAALKNNVKGTSKQVKATTRPPAPSSLTATASASAVALRWSKVKGADSYSVYMYNAKTKKFDLYKTVTGTSLKIEKLSSATTYAFRVVALRNKVKGDAKQVKATTKPLAPSAVSSTYGASTVVLEWSKVKGADSYSVYMYNAKTKKFDLYKSLTGTSVTVRGLDSATAYSFRVAAVKNKVKGDSKQINVTTRPVSTSALSASAGSSAVTLKWSKVKGADSYNVYMYNTKTKTYDLYKAVKATSLTVTGLKSATAYNFAVRAVKSDIISGAKTVSVTTRPLAPASLSATAGTSAIKLEWSKVAGADSYNVYKYNEKTKTYDLYKNVTDTTVTVTGLESAVTYAYAVRAVKAKLTGAAKVISATTRPAAVSVISASSTETSVTLTWEKVKGADEYRIYRYNEKTKKYDLCDKVTATSFTIKALSDNTDYLFSVVTVKLTADGAETTGAKKDIIARTKAGVPVQPEKITVSVNEGKATVSWTAVQGVDGYQVAYKDGQTKKNVLMGEMKPGDSVLSKGGFKKGVKYIFGVRSYRVIDGKRVYSPFTMELVTMK